MKILTEKAKRWLRTHRRSRRQAALQNLLFSAILILLLALLVPAVWEQQEQTVEEVVEQWCQDQFFGAGEIVAAQSFEEGGIQYMDVTLSRTAESGEHYEACIYMKQEKPWKWVSVGHHYGHEPLEHTARYLLAEADPVNIFDEFNMAEYSSVELLTDASGAVESAVVSVHFRSETGSEGNPSSDVKFYANLKTGEAELVSPGCYYTNRYGDHQLEQMETWLSEERMMQIAQFLAENLMAEKE